MRLATAALILGLAVGGVASRVALAQEAVPSNDIEYLQTQINTLSAQNWELQREVCTVEWRLAEQGLLLNPRATKGVCKDSGPMDGAR